MTREELNAVIAEMVAPRRSLVAQLTATTDGSFDMPMTVFVVIAGDAWAQLGVMAAIAEGVRGIARDQDAEVLTYWHESPTIHGVRYRSRGRDLFAWVRLGVAEVAGYPDSMNRPVVLSTGNELPDVSWQP